MADEELLRRLGAPFEKRLEQTTHRRALLGFLFEHGEFVSQPYLTFKPCGLLLWEPPPQSSIRCEITGRYQATVSIAPIPARWFATAKSFEELATEVNQGKEPPAWCTWDFLRPGQTVRIIVADSQKNALGPDDGIELVMWGYTSHE